MPPLYGTLSPGLIVSGVANGPTRWPVDTYPCAYEFVISGVSGHDMMVELLSYYFIRGCL